jgi:hypothetical protein
MCVNELAPFRKIRCGNYDIAGPYILVFSDSLNQEYNMMNART